MSASQDFRDGAAAGARVVAERIRAIRLAGVELTDSQLIAIAETVRVEYGAAPISDSAAREMARVV